MKTYLKPQITIDKIVFDKDISAGLGDWLDENSIDSDVEIATFTLNS